MCTNKPDTNYRPDLGMEAGYTGNHPGPSHTLAVTAIPPRQVNNTLKNGWNFTAK